MPPRFAYWTILAGGRPTSFRSTEREELLPTFERIRHTHPDAEMKWFARGRLWATPEEAQAALREERRPPPVGRDWRPGGSHRDPRQKFADAKKERNAAIRKKRFEHKQGRSDAPARDAAPAPPLGTAPWGPPRGGASSGSSRDKAPWTPPRDNARAGPPRGKAPWGPPRGSASSGPPRGGA
jgi:hypothetical protein